MHSGVSDKENIGIKLYVEISEMCESKKEYNLSLIYLNAENYPEDMQKLNIQSYVSY